MIMEKAKALCDSATGPNGEKKPIKASDGWWAKFKRRHAFHLGSMQGEDHEAPEKFKAKFVEIVAEYHPDQTFKAD